MLRLRFLGAVPLIVGTASFGQITIPGADGSDGTFNPTCAPTPCTVTVDLSQAVTGVWDMNNSANAGKGVYDAGKWAVVFKYSSVNVPTGVTVAFKNHASHAPVVWLVSGGATIAGVVSLTGSDGHNYNATTVAPSEPGPGGFRGGAGRNGSTTSMGGLGPGGGQYSLTSCTPPVAANAYGNGNGGSFGGQGNSWSSCNASCSYGSGSAGPVYGSAALFALLGGSGGSGNYRGYDTPPVGSAPGGGAGGGAILIAASLNITLNGRIESNGGKAGRSPNGCPYNGGGGSGGAIRLVTSTVLGAGQLHADGGADSYTTTGGVGRIRLEADDIDKRISSSPPYSGAFPDNPVQIFPPSESAPSVRVAQVQYTSPAGPQPPLIPPSDPRSILSPTDADLWIDTVQPATITIAADNVPASWTVTVRIVPRFGQDATANATCTSGNDPCTEWTATASIPRDTVSAVQVRAKFPGT